MEDTELYETLGISKSATQSEIKAAYRKMAVKYHPDKGGDPDKFVEVNLANEVLVNPSRRAKYDRGEGIGERGDPKTLLKERLTHMFFSLIDGVGDIDHEDLIELMGKNIKKVNEKIAQNVKNLDKDIKKLENIKSRISTEEKENIFEIMLNARSHQLKTQIEDMEKEAKISKEMKKLLDKYSYKADEERPQGASPLNQSLLDAMQATINTGSTSSTSGVSFTF